MSDSIARGSRVRLTVAKYLPFVSLSPFATRNVDDALAVRAKNWWLLAVRIDSAGPHFPTSIVRRLKPLHLNPAADWSDVIARCWSRDAFINSRYGRIVIATTVLRHVQDRSSMHACEWHDSPRYSHAWLIASGWPFRVESSFDDECPRASKLSIYYAHAVASPEVKSVGCKIGGAIKGTPQWMTKLQKCVDRLVEAIVETSCQISTNQRGYVAIFVFLVHVDLI